MPRFFVNSPIGDIFILDGENGRHASKSLRMKVSENLVLCDGKGFDYNCEITEINGEQVVLKVLEQNKNEAELPVKITLYQCIPKGDKMDLIVQKATELGVFEIVPVMSSRCISTYSGKEEKKIARLQKIALEASKQSGRGIIPTIKNPQNLGEVLKNAKGTKLFFYEKSTHSFKEALENHENEISIFIGSEGGFSEEECNLALQNNCIIPSLGKRILRTETAGLCALSVISYEVEN